MPDDYSSLPYRPCVGVMLINQQGKVWHGERIDTLGAWQMPQGGVDESESLKYAALRELEEEIGVTAEQVDIIAQTEDWLSYDLPEELLGIVWNGRYRGQKMHWFLMRFLSEDSAININTENPEFARWQWGDIDSLSGLIVPFKRKVYQSLVKQFKPVIQAQATN